MFIFLIHHLTLWQRRPGRIECSLLSDGQVSMKAPPVCIQRRSDDLIRSKVICMQLLFTAAYSLQERMIALTIIPQECFPVFEHGLGRLLRIVERVVLLAEMILYSVFKVPGRLFAFSLSLCRIFLRDSHTFSKKIFVPVPENKKAPTAPA